VYFFMNGFEECLALGRNRRPSVRMLAPGAAAPADAEIVLDWLREQKGFEVRERRPASSP
jgi:hypothetical protein